MKRTMGSSAIKRRRGQAVVELALVFPFFLLIVVGGIIDFGFAFYNVIALQQIASDAAQYGALNGGTSGLETSVINTYALAQKPSWWTGQMTANTTTLTTTTGGITYKVKRVEVSYLSPTYTPFYQTLLSAVSSSAAIPIGVVAAAQVPVNQ